MAWRKGYYKKDGTYVSGHFVNSNSNKKRKSNNFWLALFAAILSAFLAIITAVFKGLKK